MFFANQTHQLPIHWAIKKTLFQNWIAGLMKRAACRTSGFSAWVKRIFPKKKKLYLVKER